jgi:hypothetical protein
LLVYQGLDRKEFLFVLLIRENVIQYHNP